MHGRLDVVETGLLITAGQLSGITLEEGNYLRSTVFLHCHTTAPTTTLDTHAAARMWANDTAMKATIACELIALACALLILPSAPDC